MSLHNNRRCRQATSRRDRNHRHGFVSTQLRSISASQPNHFVHRSGATKRVACSLRWQEITKPDLCIAAKMPKVLPRAPANPRDRRAEDASVQIRGPSAIEPNRPATRTGSKTANAHRHLRNPFDLDRGDIVGTVATPRRSVELLHDVAIRRRNGCTDRSARDHR